jgi:hypothetical protein
MSGKINDYVRLICARLLLFMAAVTLLLFLGNLRSHYLYNAPNVSYLFLIACAYCASAGIGLLKLKKWALLLLFLPCVLFIVLYLCTWNLGSAARVPMPWALINYVFFAAMVGFPAYMLRYWHKSTW